jgi:large subunit ribosomal protein L4
MASLPIFTPAGEQAGQIELSNDVFGVEPNEALMHQAVVATLANLRQGSADTKTRGEVHHSTRKLWRQKGTGRARQGMKSAPHWKGGGIAFGPHPRDYSQSLPKKMRRKALLSALSTKVAADAITVVEAFNFERPKTKDAVKLLETLGLAEQKVLVVFDELSESVVLSFQNIPNVYMTTIDMLGTYDVLAAQRILFSRSSLENLQRIKQQPLGISLWVAKQEQGGAE